ncbi:MAG TPA: hypothetical protein VNA13_05090 [Xanthomonadales bacterium]|nr:hypothetical protein [Xanthomonadales bacterium]
MLTEKDIVQLERLFRKEYKALLKDLHVGLQRIEKRLDSIESNIADKKGLNKIETKLDKFMSIFDKLSRRYFILEKKMQAIEDYFDPERN